MAKGFTLKANAPKPKEAEWDYDAIKERMKGKSIVFCLPGRGCSFTFLKAFVQLCFDLVQNNMSIQISQDYSSMVNFARCKVLGANVLRGPNQVPWDGKLTYDYQLWIDSDIVFNTEKFWQLCDLALNEEGEEKEIVAGWYATEDGHTTSVAHWLEEDDFRKNGGVMNHENVEGISKRRKPFTVDYTGFGWVLIKKGVFENLEYPWFAPKMQVFESGAVQDMCGEDVSFCLDAKEAGFDIWCDPRIRVGHEKTRSMLQCMTSYLSVRSCLVQKLLFLTWIYPTYNSGTAWIMVSYPFTSSLLDLWTTNAIQEIMDLRKALTFAL
jgi:hypothetical protein